MLIKTLLNSTRPSFLILTPICVFLGLSTSLATQPQINVFIFSLILIGAISAHISVNMLNEYYDFSSGLDLKTEKTAFSGGSGALPDNPKMANTVLIFGIAALVLTITIGIYLIIERGNQILPIGLVGVFLIVTYTQWLNRFPLLCLIAPGIGFGTLMVVGTHVILTESNSSLPWLVSLVPFFLINNLLLLNQYPDMKADASVGRNTFPIAFNIIKSNVVYTINFMAAYLLILILIYTAYIPSLSIISVTPLMLSAFALLGAIKYTSRIGDYPHYLAANVAASILTPLLLGISIITG